MQRLKRNWIGIDITYLAVSLMKHRLHTAYGDAIKDMYQVIGEPVSAADAAALAAENPYQFQWWALGLVNARPVEQKKGADRGIDGRIFFHDEAESGKTKQIIISVKAGKTGPASQGLAGVVERENAAIGVLITMEEPTAPMRKEAATGRVLRMRRMEHQTSENSDRNRDRTAGRQNDRHSAEPGYPHVQECPESQNNTETRRSLLLFWKPPNARRFVPRVRQE